MKINLGMLGLSKKKKSITANENRPVKWIPSAFDVHGKAIVWDIVYAD